MEMEWFTNNATTIIAICAVVVSVISLVVAIRTSLSQTTLSVEYRCVYNESQSKAEEKLEWFARH